MLFLGRPFAAGVVTVLDLASLFGDVGVCRDLDHPPLAMINQGTELSNGHSACAVGSGC